MGAYVVYYHRIFPSEPAPDVTLSLFEWEMAYLKKRYRALSLKELVDYINGDLELDRPGVAITFDDGWFDNFVYACPVLKKYGLRATIFVSTGKIRSDSIVRPTLEDVWNGKLTMDALQKPKSVEDGFLESLNGNLNEFLSWDELRVMQKSGVFDIESHGVEHRRVFCGDEAKGLVKDKVNWSVLSAAPSIKEGMPLYPIKSALATKAYYPDGQGWESEEDMKKRISEELVESRNRICEEIGVMPVYFCWPWGQCTDAGIELAREAGYQACYTTMAGSISMGHDPYRIPRVSAGKSKVAFVKRGLVYSNPLLSNIYQHLSRRH